MKQVMEIKGGAAVVDEKEGHEDDSHSIGEESERYWDFWKSESSTTASNWNDY